MTEKERKDLSDRIREEWKKGNIVLLTLDGLGITPVKNLVDQPALGILYDLNRDTATSLTLLEHHTGDLSIMRLVNDIAAAHVIQYLKGVKNETDKSED